jgi:hypothetical protein
VCSVPWRAAAAAEGRLVAALLCGAASGLAGAQVPATLVLVPAADSTLIEEAAGGLANGAGERFFVGRVGANAGSTRRRALLRFDLSGLPAGAQVTAVSLSLSLERSRQAGDLPITLHRVTQSWAEGPTASVVGIGEPAVDGDTTWLHRSRPTSTWTVPGGDFVAAASASRIVGSTGGPVSWSSTPALVADVQGWLAQPASNHGWALLGFEAGGTSAKGFASREALAPADRPQLRIDYLGAAPTDEADIPIPPWALVALGLGLGAALWRRGAPGRRTLP